jgi:hypothetical protein
MNKSDREWIQREFDLTRDVMKEHHEALKDHVKHDEKFQERVVKTAKWAVAGIGAAGLTVAGWFFKL